jgi:hypothetical protein
MHDGEYTILRKQKNTEDQVLEMKELLGVNFALKHAIRKVQGN